MADEIIIHDSDYEEQNRDDSSGNEKRLTITGLASETSPVTRRFGHMEPRGKIYATNWLRDISTSADFPAVLVQFKNTRSGFYSNPSLLNLEIGDIVAVEANPGHDIGKVTMVGPLVRRQMVKSKVDPENIEALKRVFRKATASDLERFNEARNREHQTMIDSRRIAESLGLNMKIGDVEYQGDGGKAIFYYIADDRVDFRKLIRILADEFKVRIEMKQIGARQEAGRIGGIGPCGRPLCCSSWMTHFVSVGTGAARIQDLSMSPQKLAGQCAKLKCCLNFELPVYSEASKQIPPKDVVLSTHDGDFFFFKADILSRMITYSTDSRIAANLVTIPAERAFEIIALNKQGIKVDQLSLETESETPHKEYIDLTDQDSLTRFDKAKKKKKKNRNSGQRQEKRENESQSRKVSETSENNQNNNRLERGDKNNQQKSDKPLKQNHGKSERPNQNRKGNNSADKSERSDNRQRQQRYHRRNNSSNRQQNTPQNKTN